ncbi:MAG TPA: M13 family metallopeptidase [Polyangia bacterium]|nr:M13 family metallopeptidase [Polyangia bacterium]
MRISWKLTVLFATAMTTGVALGRATTPAPSDKPERPLASMPYTPSLDPAAMDKSVDPCVDFYAYSCGGWIKENPIPPDQAHWSVYGKLADENVRFLWGALEEAAQPKPGRLPVEQQIGDYFAACMDEAAVEKAGAAPLRAELDTIAKMRSLTELPAFLGKEHLAMHGSGMLFGFGSTQDAADSNSVIAEAGAGGLGLPDRDYYVKTDKKSVEVRDKYLAHVAEMLALSGEPAATAKKHAQKILAFETTLAKASLTRVERRNPYNLYHKVDRAKLQAMTPSFKWDAYLTATGSPSLSTFNVDQPAFLAAVEKQLTAVDLDTWKAYLRWHLVSDRAPYLSKAFVDADFAFYSKYLRGVVAQRPRWKRCVHMVDRDLGEALGQVFVKKTFGADVKQRTVAMTAGVERAMESEIRALPWMGAKTKEQALGKLHTIVNKVGYPDKWRDYSSVKIARDDFAGDVARAGIFESRRELDKVGKPLDRGEWGMTPPTVNAYYNPQMNDINFPAGVLQPPLFDAKLDDAPNFGNTGATIGHELTHGFDDEGRQFDAKGNLRDWWTKDDGAQFEKRAACVSDQYAQYVIVDDIKINSKLTLGEDVADLGGTWLAYLAWKAATHGQKLQAIGGFSPEQRFFVGMAQWACENERPEDLRVNAVTNPHSPGKYRINGVVANMPEFAKAFACRAGQPMVRATPCKIW